jgi:rod shape-determining protein MreC
MSVLNSNFEITSWIPKIGLRQGAVKWDFKNTSSGIIDEINRSEAIKKGQNVLTSNYSSIFPPGTPIGKIARVVNSEKSQYLQIRVRFATDFKRLNHVYCVKNLFSQTLDQLKTEELND